MNFSWTPEQLKLKQEAIEFAQNELNENISERERNNEFPRADWKKCAEFGIQGLTVPEAYSGRGVDPLTTLLIMEGLGYGCKDNGLPFSLNSQMWSFQPSILKFGSEVQKKKYLPPICRGELVGAFGITEVESGSDSYAMQMTATEVEGGYILNGRKSYITLAPVCDLCVIFASTDLELGRWGITAFIVEKGTKGFSTSPVRDKMGMRTTPMGDLIFEDCFIPAENILGPEGGGVSLFTTAMESERGYIFASQVGRLERQLEEAIEYAKSRQSFGQPIGKFQSVSNRIADMKLKLELGKFGDVQSSMARRK